MLNLDLRSHLLTSIKINAFRKLRLSTLKYTNALYKSKISTYSYSIELFILLIKLKLIL